MSLTPKKFADRYRVNHGAKFDLAKRPTDDVWKVESKKQGTELLQKGIDRLTELQSRLYAQDQSSLLIVLQAMDAAGKDGIIKHVMSGLNPQGCEVHSFKAPSATELDHDFLWRAHQHVPERGRIGIFNRSHYEEVLVVRVHPEFLEGQRIPPRLVTKEIWTQRYRDIVAFEDYLTHNGVVVRKFFLHMSRDEQKKRFLDRLDRPEKNWKFSTADAQERGHWEDYMNAYDQMIRHTSTQHSPWYVVPADHKWYARLVVAAAIVETLESLDLQYPTVDDARKKQFAAVRAALVNEP